MSFADGLATPAALNSMLCFNYVLDARGVVCPTRSGSTTYFDFSGAPLHNLGISAAGTGSIAWLTPGEAGTGNPAQINSAHLSTGSAIGSAAWCGVALRRLPANYGIQILAAFPVNSGQMADGLWMQFQNTANNAALLLNLNGSGIYAQSATGDWRLLSAHCPPWACETWLEVADNGLGWLTVRTYQGTRFVSEVSLQAPIGKPANAGFVIWRQQSGVTANQTTDIFQIGIGTSQLADEMVIAWLPSPAPYIATAVNLKFDVEDTCANIGLNADFSAEVEIAGSFTPVPLAEITPDPAPRGIIDNTKAIRSFAGSIAAQIAQGQPILPRCRLGNHKFGALLTATVTLTSTGG